MSGGLTAAALCFYYYIRISEGADAWPIAYGPWLGGWAGAERQPRQPSGQALGGHHMAMAQDAMPLFGEISHGIPPDMPRRYIEGGNPLLTAYGCVLLECAAGAGYAYRAVSIKTGRSELLIRKRSPVAGGAGLAAMVDRMRLSSVAGAGKLQVDRPGFDERMDAPSLRAAMETIFREILPGYGYAIRESQIALSCGMLESLGRRGVSLDEAEVGVGKTHAYLLAAILAKRGRMNDYWNMGLYPGMQYAEMRDMPVVVSTSSIALQKAIASGYIPELSRILLERGVIRKPITAAIRKGKENYICDRNLLRHLPFEQDAKMKAVLCGLAKAGAPIDLSEQDGLTAHAKRVICVPSACPQECPQLMGCRYRRHLSLSQSREADIQICNHNYFLADALRRAKGQRPLIPNYQAAVIDEAHKFLQAARQMYGIELSCASISSALADMRSLRFKDPAIQQAFVSAAKKLGGQNRRLFKRLAGPTPQGSGANGGGGGEAERTAVGVDAQAARHLDKIRSITDELYDILSQPLAGNRNGLRDRLRGELDSIGGKAADLARRKELICWIERQGGGAFPRCTQPGGAPVERAADGGMPVGAAPAGGGQGCQLCAVPKDLGACLRRDIWSKGFPIILSSGTLSAGGDFTRAKQTLGLAQSERLTETSKQSPFNLRQNAAIYISESVPFPDLGNERYLPALADEVELLIRAAHGHAAVLFTSYRALGHVHSALERRSLPFPMFSLERGGVAAIGQFKASGNGILLASGAFWDGIDIPGDALSLLAIVKLPFAAPDPISEYEQAQYADRDEYKRRVVVPDMLLKLRQGFGRLIRTETDTGVAALLDSRVRAGGAYRRAALDALPPCAVLSRIEEVASFMKHKKQPGYFADDSQRG